MSALDVIGDLHGHAGQLVRLLEKLGYERRAPGSAYAHPAGRKAVFVGDFIDRGPRVAEVLRIVCDMTDTGTAFAVLGNHEFNLLVEELSGNGQTTEECREYMDWFRGLPLSLELEGIRVVHAAWHRPSLEVVAGRTCEDEEFVRLAATKGTPEHKAARILVKGIKVPLPRDKVYRDRFGIPRTKGRIRWWLDPTGVSYADLLFPPCEGVPGHEGPPSIELEEGVPYAVNEPPVFLGHYCLLPSVPKIQGNIACVDGCVTCDGILWAYRFDGERTLEPARLVQSS